MEASSLEFSKDAALFAVTDASGVRIYDVPSRSIKHRFFECSGVLATAFSPKASFLITFQRPIKGPDGNTKPNLRVWSTETGNEVLSLHQKILTKDHWPSVQFTSDESIAVHMVTNTLHVYDPKSFSSGPSLKFPVKGIGAFAIAPIAECHPIAAIYVPEAKGSPGFIALYSLSRENAESGRPTPLCRRSFYRANSARFSWSPTGSAVLVTTASDVDATNQSYYGEQKLFFLSADGSNEMPVPLPKEGPIHDVQWNPRGDYFVTVAGFMPAKTTLFTSKCVPKFDLGSGPYSMARWNPFGRFLVLAGFGNLPGDLAFFDKKADGKCKPMGTSRAENGVTLEWSPCGRYILAATIAPRLRVENGMQIFKYDGSLIAKDKRDVLYQSCWVPAAAGTFEDRPQSPRTSALDTQTGSSAAAAKIQQPTKPTGYIPPHLRNNPAAASAARASFSLARDPDDTGGFITGRGKGARSTASAVLPPGAAPPVSRAASKNAKRRAKKKMVASQDEDDDVANDVSNMKL